MSIEQDGALRDVQEVVSDVGARFHQVNLVLSCASIFINTFHLIVLFRKSMRTSSTNILLIGLSISDVCIVLTTVYKHIAMLDIDNSECVTADSRLKAYVDMTIWSIQVHFRRCGTWLGVLMATVRFLIVKKMNFASYGNWSKPSTGWIIILTVFCISGLQMTFYQSRWMVVENRIFPLPLICSDHQNIYRSPPFSLALTPFFNADDRFVLRIYLLFDAIVTKFIPCISFPILTFLLLRALRKMKESNAKSGKKISVTKEERKELTTTLIVFLTASFFVTEAPLGLIYLVKAYFDKTDPILLISTDFVIYFGVLVTINSILHPIFCIFMSSQYRDSIRKMIGFQGTKKLSTRNKTSATSGPIVKITRQQM